MHFRHASNSHQFGSVWNTDFAHFSSARFTLLHGRDLDRRAADILPAYYQPQNEKYFHLSTLQSWALSEKASDNPLRY